MSLLRWRPLHDLEEFFEINKSHGFDLAVDMHDDKNTLTLKMNIPGINPDKIDIHVHDHQVRISGSRDEESETKNRHYFRKEIRRGSFERIVELPTTVIEDKTSAEYKDGVLSITFYKKQEGNNGQGKKINVKKG